MCNDGFKIICNKCNNIVEVQNHTCNGDYKSKYFLFYPIQCASVNIICNKCGNEVYISDDD